MAIKKNKEKTTGTKATYDIKVTRAHELDNCIMFDMDVNGVSIYGCNYRTLTRKDNGEEFAKIGFPAHKGNDGKYYNYAYFKITEETLESIEKQIEALI